MPEPFRINFRGFTGLDFSDARRCQGSRAGSPLPGESSLIRAGISAAAAAGNNKGRLLANGLERCEGGPGLIISGTIPGARIPPTREWTIAEGLTAGVGAGVGISYGAGIYMWCQNPGLELGLYGSFAAGLITNLGAGGGVQYAYMFGPAPSVLAGDSIAISVSVDAGFMSLGGTLYLSAPPGGVTPPAGSGGSISAWLTTLASLGTYTPQVIGVGYQATVGVSVLPADISIMPGRTWTRSVATIGP
jgi:hypothetical protein